MKRSFILAFIVLLLGIKASFSQPVYERHTYEVYHFLSRLAQKGVLIFNDNIRPLSKSYIASCLDSVEAKKAELTVIERAELAFYQKEFTEGVRKRIFSANKEDFSIYADPIITGSFTSRAGKEIKSSSSGINVWGRAGKHWGYQFSFHDTNEKGAGIDSSRKSLEAGAATGVVIQDATATKQSFTELRASIHYVFDKGFISVGQDYLLTGYGETGRLILSDKAPVYPYIRFDYQPVPWLKFNYTHAWLRSNLVDSQRSYTIPSGIFTGIRTVEINKYMASHSLEFTLSKGLNFLLGESVIYNENVNFGYLIPVMFFKAFDKNSSNNAIEKGSNGQFFFQFNSRNQVKNTHLYATLFIDEIRATTLLDKSKSRNQLGYTVGGSLTDVGGVNYFTLGAEYTRVRPFVYRNFLPAQNYTHQDYLLGDWLGNNADRLTLFAKYTPLPKLKLNLRYMHIRKGGAGTLNQQYQQQPQPPFLFDFQQKSDEVFLGVTYEYLHRFYLNSSFQRFDNRNILFFGFTYGL